PTQNGNATCGNSLVSRSVVWYPRGRLKYGNSPSGASESGTFAISKPASASSSAAAPFSCCPPSPGGVVGACSCPACPACAGSSVSPPHPASAAARMDTIGNGGRNCSQGPEEELQRVERGVPAGEGGGVGKRGECEGLRVGES